MTNRIASNKDQCLALLALYFQKNKPDNNAGPTPGDEELEALYGNDSELDPIRRQQVFNHLANDETVYRRWLELIEYIHDIESALINQKTTPAKKNNNNRIQRLFSELTDWFKLPRLAGATSIVALLAVFTIFSGSFNTYQSKVDTIYAGYTDLPPVASSSSLSTLPSRSAGQTKTIQPITPAEFFIAEGLKQGLTELDKKLASNSSLHLDKQLLATKQTTEKLPSKHQDMLVSLGRLAALTHLRCRYSINNRAFTRKTLPLFEELIERLISLHYLELEPLHMLSAQDIGDEKRLCLYGDLLTQK